MCRRRGTVVFYRCLVRTKNDDTVSIRARVVYNAIISFQQQDRCQ